LPDPVRLEPAREAMPVAVELEGPAGELPAEGRRLSMDAVRAADADRVAMLFGPPDDRVEGAVETCEEQLPGVLDLQRERSVDDVGGGEAVVDPAAFGAELLGDRVDERGDIVVSRALDLGDALGRRRPGSGTDRCHVSSRDGAQFRPPVE